MRSYTAIYYFRGRNRDYDAYRKKQLQANSIREATDSAYGDGDGEEMLVAVYLTEQSYHLSANIL